MSSNAAVATNFADILMDFGNIPASRVRSEPKPGAATIEDLLQVNSQGGMYELVDGALVEKAMGWRESLIARALGSIIRSFVLARNLGRILRTQVRAPDLAFVSWDRLPGGKVPEDKVPELVPDLAIEVLSENGARTPNSLLAKPIEYEYRQG